MREPALRFRTTHPEEAQAATGRVQGDDSGQPDGLRGQVPERVHVRLPVGHVRFGVQDVLAEPVHPAVAPGTAGRGSQFRLSGEYLSER